MVDGRLKGSPCLQRADEGHTTVNALGRTSYLPNPKVPPRDFRTPLSRRPNPHALGGVLMGAEALGTRSDEGALSVAYGGVGPRCRCRASQQYPIRRGG